jgi:hypothetical protein
MKIIICLFKQAVLVRMTIQVKIRRIGSAGREPHPRAKKEHLKMLASNTEYLDGC